MFTFSPPKNLNYINSGLCSVVLHLVTYMKCKTCRTFNDKYRHADVR